MNEAFNSFFLNLGATGVMIARLVWFSKRMFTEFLRKYSELEKKYETLEARFHDYLISTAKEHHEIIRNNTEAYNKFVNMIDNYLQRIQRTIK
jgi:hypothetical protein